MKQKEKQPEAAPACGEDFLPIHNHPGYRISVRGEVLSEKSGAVLSVDKRGRVNIREGSRYVPIPLTELFRLSAHMSHVVPRDGGEAQDKEKEELEKSLRHARKLNGHLLALVRRLQEEKNGETVEKRKKAKAGEVKEADTRHLISREFDAGGTENDPLTGDT